MRSEKRFIDIGTDMGSLETESEDQQLFTLNPLLLLRNAFPVFQDETRCIVNALFGPEEYAIFESIIGETDIDVALEELITITNVQWVVLGKTFDDVFAVYPDIEGETMVGTDDDGNFIFQNICKRYDWKTQGDKT